MYRPPARQPKIKVKKPPRIQPAPPRITRTVPASNAGRGQSVTKRVSFVPPIPGYRAPTKKLVKPKVARPVKRVVSTPRATTYSVPRSSPPRPTSTPVRAPGAPPRRAPVRPPTRPVAAPQVDGSMDTSGADDEQAYIDAILGPGRQQLDYLRQQQQLADQQKFADIKGLTDEFMHYLSGVPGQVQADYSAAINQQMGMGREAQQALASASTNPQVQQDLAAIGAPQAQEQQVSDKLGQTFNGGGAVLLGTGGQIPAQQLSSDQAAQLAFVRSLPAVAASTGQQTLRAYLQQSQGAYSDINQQYQQLLSQVPKLLLDYRSQQSDAAAKAAQLDLEYKALGLRGQNQRFQQGATKVRLTQAQQRLQNSQNQQTLSNQYRFAEIYGYDPKTGKPTLAAIKAAKADAKKAKRPVSASALKNWNLFAEDAYHGVSPKTRYDSKTGTFVPVPPYTTINGVVYTKPPLQYYPALKKLMAMGATLAQAQKVLNSLYVKGEGGRPHVSLQGRLGLAKAGMPLAHPNDTPSAQQLEWLQQHGLWSD